MKPDFMAPLFGLLSKRSKRYPYFIQLRLSIFRLHGIHCKGQLKIQVEIQIKVVQIRAAATIAPRTPDKNMKPRNDIFWDVSSQPFKAQTWPARICRSALLTRKG